MRTATHQLGPPDELAHGDFEMVVRRLADDLAFGTDASLFVGSGLEYAQSRAYQSGDSIKMMDWRLTARTGRPFVKEYETLKRTCVYIVVDTSASMNAASGWLSKHDLAIWIAAGVGLLAQRRLSPVALVGAGERETRLNPSLHQSALWQALEPLRTGSPAERTRLAEQLRMLGVRAERTSVILVISDLHEQGSQEALRALAQRHDCIVAHLIDPAEAGSLRSGFFLGHEAESGRTFFGHGRSAWTRVEEIERQVVRCGVGAVRLRTDQPFIAPLRHFLSARSVAVRRGT